MEMETLILVGFCFLDSSGFLMNWSISSWKYSGNNGATFLALAYCLVPGIWSPIYKDTAALKFRSKFLFWILDREDWVIVQQHITWKSQWSGQEMCVNHCSMESLCTVLQGLLWVGRAGLEVSDRQSPALAHKRRMPFLLRTPWQEVSCMFLPQQGRLGKRILSQVLERETGYPDLPT